MFDILAVFLVATGCGFASTFVARALAWRVGLVDRPDGRRKIHTRPVAVCGGLAVLVGGLAALAAAAAGLPEVRAAVSADPTRSLAFLGSAVLMAAVGLVDDAVNLRARYKLVGQVAAAGLLIYPGGLRIEEVSLFGLTLPLAGLAVPVTLLWLLTAVNALNLLDGMDGFLGTVGVVACVALAFMAHHAGSPLVMWVALVLAGAVVGFLRFNLPPASVYLGDCGSMLIGLVVGASALMASLKGPAVAIVGPACLLVLPMLDTTAAVVRRKLTGRGLAVGDRGHLHHVLRAHGLPARRVLALVAALGSVAAGGALGATYLENDLFAVVAALAVVLILLAGGLFGNAELRLVRERAAVVVKKAAAGARPHVELEVRLQGSVDWAEVWHEITRAAEELNLHTVCLDVNAPAWHEGYHRRLDRLGRPPADLKQWRVELPLFGHGQVIGRLTVAGVRDTLPVADKMRILSEIVDAAESRAVEVVTRSGVMAAARPSAAPSSPAPAPAPAAAPA